MKKLNALSKNLNLPRAFLLGTIFVIIIATLRMLIVFLLENLHDFWSPLLITFGITGRAATAIGYTEAMLYTLTLVIIIGLILLTKRGGEGTIGDKIFSKIPIINIAWRFFLSISEIVHHISERPFVLVLDHPSEGHEAIGIVTRKQNFISGDNTRHSKPMVFIFTLPNLSSGLLDFPKRDKLVLLNSPANKLMATLISIGLVGSENMGIADDQSPIDEYYS